MTVKARTMRPKDSGAEPERLIRGNGAKKVSPPPKGAREEGPIAEIPSATPPRPCGPSGSRRDRSDDATSPGR